LIDLDYTHLIHNDTLCNQKPFIKNIKPYTRYPLQSNHWCCPQFPIIHDALWQFPSEKHLVRLMQSTWRFFTIQYLNCISLKTFIRLAIVNIKKCWRNKKYYQKVWHRLKRMLVACEWMQESSMKYVRLKR